MFNNIVPSFPIQILFYLQISIQVTLSSSIRAKISPIAYKYRRTNLKFKKKNNIIKTQKVGSLFMIFLNELNPLTSRRRFLGKNILFWNSFRAVNSTLTKILVSAWIG